MVVCGVAMKEAAATERVEVVELVKEGVVVAMEEGGSVAVVVEATEMYTQSTSI